MTNTTSIEQHPDLMELRARYDRAAETPVARALEGFTFLAGLYTAVSPWVVGFTNHSDVATNNLIVGLALAVLAIGFASAYGRTHNLAWVAPIIGVWTIIVPWVVLGSPVPVNMIVNNVITGGVAVLLGLAMAATGARTGRRTR
ncbi:SPW repeat protein [Amycolatopsis pigmentata]|uniref:SPW repeat protein n=1 Tax=Amycolatopsis pigmentata TaxID=450801 RepID=A0ABW5FKZ4_9PSEU